MDIELLFDPLFRLPFVTGLLLAITLPLLGPVNTNGDILCP